MSAAAKKKQKAWGDASKSEPRWPASLAVLFAAGLNFALPGKFTLGPPWLLPAMELAVMVPLNITSPRRVAGESRAVQIAAFAVIALATVANTAALVFLVRHLILEPASVNGRELLYSSLAIWLSNVMIFGLWFWELDRGGPDDRLSPDHGPPDFLFPQMTTPSCTHDDWAPSFFDYLYVSFTNATAFSPTDTLPLSPFAKALMLIESLASLATIALVASRAVNILN